MTVVGSVPFDAAWQLDTVVPNEDHSFPFHDGLDVEMHDRVDVLSSNDTNGSSLHHDMHDYIEPLPFIYCSSPSESFYAASQRHSGCSVSNGDEATILPVVPPSNIRFVSPMQNRPIQASRESDHSAAMVSNRSSCRSFSRQQCQKRRQTETFFKSVPLCPKSETIPDERHAIKSDDPSESDGSSYDDDKLASCRYYYDYYRHEYRREAHSKHPDIYGFHSRNYDEHMREYLPQTFLTTRERMISFMHRSEETRSQVLMHLQFYPLDSPICVHSNVESFHSTRVSTSTLFQSWSIHPDDRYPHAATSS